MSREKFPSTDRLVCFRLLVVACLGGALPRASAQDCSEAALAEFRKSQTQCKPARTALAEFRKRCVDPFTEMVLEKSVADACDPCRGAAGALVKQLTLSPATCIEKIDRLVATERAVSCLGGARHHADVARFANEVSTCGDDPAQTQALESQLGQATSCEEARTDRRRAERWAKEAKAHAKQTVHALLEAARKQETELCRDDPPREVVRKLDELFSDAKNELQKVTDEIAARRECAAPEGCPELRRKQVRYLALYLEFFARSSITTPEDEAEARARLRGIGLAPNVLDLIAQYGADAVRSYAELSRLLGNSTLQEKMRTKLKNDPAAAHAFEELLKYPAAQAFAKLREIPPEQRERLVAASLDIGFEQELARRGKFNEKELRQLDIVVATPSGPGACKPFVERVLSEITGAGPVSKPMQAAPKDFPAQIALTVDRRRSGCGYAAASREGAPEATRSALPGCGSVLGLLVEPGPGNTLMGRVELHHVLPGEGAKAASHWISPLELSAAPDDQVRAAEDLVVQIRLRFDRAPPAVPGYEPERPAEHCGISVMNMLRHLPPPRGKGFVVVLPTGAHSDAASQAKRTAFSDDFLANLRFRQRLLGPEMPDAPVQIRVRSFDVESRTRFEIVVDDRTASPTSRASFAVVIDEKAKCPKDPQQTGQALWAIAGVRAAEEIVNYYRSVERRDELTTRLLLPGLAWIPQGGKAKAGGILWASADVGLLGSGILLVALSIKERNDYPEESGALDRASNLQYAGFGLLGAFLLERVVWAFLDHKPSP